jgi:glycosyltransferase involved in cell wall biosynthesis
VLLVTGAYEPEISAAAVVCRAVVRAAGSRAAFSVLTTAVDPALPRHDTIDGIPIYRAHVDAGSIVSKSLASARLPAQFLSAAGRFDIVHIHGVSQKNIAAVALAKLLGKRVIVHLHTAGQDEPAVIRRAGVASWWAFRQADLVLSVSPLLANAYLAAGLDETRLRPAPNGVDLERFTPSSAERRAAARRELGLPGDVPMVLYVGFFSRDKRADALFRAWRRVACAERDSILVFVGAVDPTYYEVDGSLASAISAQAAAAGVGSRVIFAAPTPAIERYFAAADLFALPSIREAMPLALLEAMASGLPCIASRLPGATDVLVDDGIDGRLVPPDDERAWAEAIGELVRDPARARALGRAARATAVGHYGIDRSADAWLDAYREVLQPMVVSGERAVMAGRGARR